jgi:hypothetical protein
MPLNQVDTIHREGTEFNTLVRDAPSRKRRHVDEMNQKLIAVTP